MSGSRDWPRPTHRPRRLRRSEVIRRLVQETHLTPDRLILPQFVLDGSDREEPIGAMPGRSRLSIDRTINECEKAASLGVRSFALFPAIDPSLKTPEAREAVNPENLLCRAVGSIKEAFPESCLVTDVALDPYSSLGHDGLAQNGQIVNDAAKGTAKRLRGVWR